MVQAGGRLRVVIPDAAGKDVFVHISAVNAAGMKPLYEGQRISYECELRDKGLMATNLINLDV